jgi:subtilisin family serine protease
MKKTIGILALVAILLVITVSFVSAGTAGPVEPKTPPLAPAGGPMTAEDYSAWFVEFESEPTVKGTSLQTLLNERDSFLTDATTIGLDFDIRYEFSSLWNGMSVNIANRDVNKLFSLRGVKAIYPVTEVELPETFAGEEPDLFSSLGMIGADVAQSELGYDGSGVKVAVMDTGIDYDHPDLGGCFGNRCKVAMGYDFVGDDYDYGLTPVPDSDPDDCNGHGTHVAGIIAANGEVVGVAPKVMLGAYRVFGCEGSTDSDIMLAAMERILADDMDVLNMSIGSAYTWPQYPTAVGANNLVDAGVVVVASIGNSGANGLYAAGAPGLGEKVIGVASFDNVMKTFPYAIVDGTLPEQIEGVPFGVIYDVMQYSPPAPTSGTEPIVYIGRACNGDPLAADPTGALALVRRGDCGFYDKALNAINAGATGVVIHNNTTGIFYGTLGTAIDDIHPVVSISYDDGMDIRALETATWRWTDNIVSVPSSTGGLISSFSSYGLSPDLAVKPDIGAPGGDIWSTVPLEQGGHASMGGTSMASPHVAGAAALMLDAFPGMPATQMRDVLMNTAEPQLWSLNTTYGLYDHVYRQGAGLVQVDNALMSDVTVTPGKLAVKEGAKTFTLQVMNRSPYPQTYALSWESAVAAAGVLTIDGFWVTDETVSFSQDTVHVAPFGSTAFNVTITPPTAAVPWNTLYSGWINLTPMEYIPDMLYQQVYRVPYAGFAGDYQDIVHTANPYGLPALTDADWNDVPEGYVFTMQGIEVPTILWHLEHQASVVKLEVLSGLTGRRANPFFFTVWEEEYYPRNSAPNTIFVDSWDATRLLWNRMVAMPDGAYQLRMSVLKALGDPMNHDDWEHSPHWRQILG